jgi:endonuclease YncB( thermonuclease family)
MVKKGLDADTFSANWHYSAKDGLWDHGREGRMVTLRTDPTQTKTDQHGRLLANVNRGRSDVGRRQISEGWAEGVCLREQSV